jgi:hypothetical protein
MEKYDWIIIGGGISGITSAEILTREGFSVLLLEKNDSLASETSKVFHEWLHTGALYTLAPDKLNTTRYLLGAIDDLLEFYQSFPGMNLKPSDSGLKIINHGWFNNKNIEMHYRNRKFNPVWLAMISRSASIVQKINSHDWLRRKAGSIYGDTKLSRRRWVTKIPELIKSDQKFIKVQSPDVTINSRELITDILNQAIDNGLVIKTGETVLSVSNKNNEASVYSNQNTYFGKNVLVCAPNLIEALFNKKIKISYAPIAVVSGVPDSASNFVELDCYTKNCINLLTKGNGIGLAGGISVKKSDVDSYTNYVVNQQVKKHPSIKLIDKYVGLKKEIVSKRQDRNYLYHIEQEDSNIWSLVLGKFTLAFSSAPELIRRVYGRNPKKVFQTSQSSEINSYISKTSWQEIVDVNKKEK